MKRGSCISILWEGEKYSMYERMKWRLNYFEEFIKNVS